jgi:hypothetical protein
MSKKINVIQLKDIIKSAEEYGRDKVFTWDPVKFRGMKKSTNKKTDNKQQNDCNWLPIKFKKANGEEVPVNIKFRQVVITSAAKVPQGQEKDKVKHLNIAFRRITKDELITTTFKPKESTDEKPMTEEEQISERKKNETLVDELVENTNLFNEAMEIINESYKFICQELKAAKNLEFSVKKNKNIKDVVVFPFIQYERENKENPDEDPIKLEQPITRIKLLVDKKNGLIGVDNWDNDKKKFVFKPNVYDVRKMTSKNNRQPVLATVKVQGESQPLDKDNAQAFITYNSVAGGIIKIPEIIVSLFGLSLNQHFDDLFIKRNKTSTTEPKFSKEELTAMAGNESNESDDDVEINTVDAPLINSISKAKITANEEVSDIEDKSDIGSDLEAAGVVSSDSDSD